MHKFLLSLSIVIVFIMVRGALKEVFNLPRLLPKIIGLIVLLPVIYLISSTLLIIIK